MEVSVQNHPQTACALKSLRYPLSKRLDGLQNESGLLSSREISRHSCRNKNQVNKEVNISNANIYSHIQQ
jgi:hypothetical protein